jgi:hypothetical protein
MRLGELGRARRRWRQVRQRQTGETAITILHCNGQTSVTKNQSPMTYSTGSTPALPRLESERNKYTETCAPEVASSRVRGFFNCFRKIDAHNPEAFTSAMIAVLCKYPEQIVFRATDPVGALATKHKYPPSIADVAEFCEGEMKPWRDLDARDRRRSETAKVIGFSPEQGTQAERTAFIDRFARENPDLVSERFVRERFRRQVVPLDEDALRAKYADKPVKLSAGALAALNMPVPKDSFDAVDF